MHYSIILLQTHAKNLQNFKILFRHFKNQRFFTVPISWNSKILTAFLERIKNINIFHNQISCWEISKAKYFQQLWCSGSNFFSYIFNTQFIKLLKILQLLKFCSNFPNSIIPWLIYLSDKKKIHVIIPFCDKRAPKGV